MTKNKDIIVVGDLFADNGHNSAAGRVYGVGGVAPTLGSANFQIEKWILVKENDNGKTQK